MCFFAFVGKEFFVAKQLQKEADDLDILIKEHDVLLHACLKLQSKTVHAIAYLKKNKNYKLMGKWTEFSDAITELLLNSDYIADDLSNNNYGIITRNDRNMNDNNDETENNDHSERKSNNDGNIPANNENTSNNNNDQNSTITTTHINGLQLTKDANIAMPKPYQNKRISNGTSKRDMSSSNKKPLINLIKR